jgi:hypothetical protein
MSEPVPSGRPLSDAEVRAELAALPTPATPQHVRDGVRRAVAAEADRIVAAANSPAVRTASAVPAQRTGPTRRRSLLLAGTGVAPGAALLGAPQPWQDPAPPAPAAQAPADAPAAPEGARQGGAAAALLPADILPVLRASGTAYEAATFQSQVAGTLGAASRQPTPATPATLQAAADAAACVNALPRVDPLPVLVDASQYAGIPALVVAYARPEGWEVVVQRRSCTAEDPAVLLRATVDDG